MREVPQTVILDEKGHVIFTRIGVVDRDAALDSIVAAARVTGIGSAGRERVWAANRTYLYVVPWSCLVVGLC